MSLLDFKFHFFMVIANIACAVSYFITSYGFSEGMPPPVYTTYRLAIGGISLLPFAYCIERTKAPSLSWWLLCKICALSLLGTCLPLITFFEGMSLTSPSIAAAINNTIPGIVFIMALILRMEAVNIRTWRGMAKVVGALLSLAGVTTMAIYKGRFIDEFKQAPIRMEHSNRHENLIQGSALVVVSCISLSVSYILQARTLDVYPAKISLSVLMNLIGATLSGVYAVATTSCKAEAWALGRDMRLWAILYGGICGSGFLIFVQLWCTKVKGAVFMTMFNPVTTIVSVLTAYFVLGSKLYLGSIIGSLVVIVGLYCLIWGKLGDPPAPAAAESREEV